VSLLSLFLITAVIFVLTLLLYRSFRNHQQVLGLRWKARGEAALQAGHPKEAVDALRSALAYVPDRDTEIDLATALAQAGRTVEATAYFNTLWESAPGDGMINLQLARLAVREGNEKLALLHYQSALDGTWQGNGYARRRQVRLEMVRYLLSRRQYDQVRNQLLIAASNAPDDPAIKIEIAGLFEQANDLGDALGLYRSVADRRGAPVAALEGAGRAAFHLGMYRVASQYLGRALASPLAATLPDNEGGADRTMLDASARILLLFPALDLPPRARAQRLLALRDIARERLTRCAASNVAAPSQLASLLARWDQLPAQITVKSLEQQPDLEQTLLQLAFNTETVTAQVCGAPSGDDALLLRMAQNPGAVEQE
jgi:tetratricopeptide (TPR) repeat protein